MENWNINKNNWYISWYNFRNLPEDDYSKKYNDVYQNMKKFGIESEFYKYILKIKYKGYGLEAVHIFNSGTRLIWHTKKYLYWLILREGGKWTLKFTKSKNTGDCCR